jgi:NADP-reducing hydrogenase subunit HndB
MNLRRDKMTSVKSLDDLKRIREEALEKRKVKATSGQAQVIVAMGTCGIAAGARDAMKAILDTIETDGLTGIIVTQTGCIGLCDREPIVQVVVGEQAKVTYGKVTPDVARRIMREHVVNGKVVEGHVIPV